MNSISFLQSIILIIVGAIAPTIIAIIEIRKNRESEKLQISKLLYEKKIELYFNLFKKISNLIDNLHSKRLLITYREFKRFMLENIVIIPKQLFVLLIRLDDFTQQSNQKTKVDEITATVLQISNFCRDDLKLEPLEHYLRDFVEKRKVNKRKEIKH